MKTHMNNTQAKMLDLDTTAKALFYQHQKVLHSNIKPVVSTRRTSEVKIVKNNKKTLMKNPDEQMHTLFKKLHNNKNSNYKSNIDNKNVYYELDKKILSKKIQSNKQEQYMKSQHQRQLRSAKSRIDNCKSYQQRKKNNCDPIVNPTYFMRDKSTTKDISIDNYSKKIINKNKPSGGTRPSTAKVFHQQPLVEKAIQPMAKSPVYNSSVPDYSKNNRPQSAPNKNKNYNQRNLDLDLPAFGFKPLMQHIINNKLYRDSDLKVLYVRMCHRYGEQEMEQIWEPLMDELQREV